MKSTMWQNTSTDSLFDAILSLKNIEESRNFFRDLLTEEEILEFANRWKVAQMLNNKIPYTQIEKNTGMSSTTIARISKWLTKGQGGYRTMIARTSKLHHTSNTSRMTPGA
jgi:TrpR-related protein YerC/YecD